MAGPRAFALNSVPLNKDRRSQKQTPSSKAGSGERCCNPSPTGLGSPPALQEQLSSGVSTEEPHHWKASAGALGGPCKDLDQISQPVLSPWHPEAILKPGPRKLLTWAESGRTEDAGCSLTSNPCVQKNAQKMDMGKERLPTKVGHRLTQTHRERRGEGKTAMTRLKKGKGRGN